MSQIEAGTMVELKSGSPVMTVQHVGSGGKTVNCKWFDGDKKEQVGDFAIASLNIVTEEDLEPPMGFVQRG